jgi:hypothetical protein
MTASWKDVLERPRAGEHVAQVYRDPEFLLDAVSHYVASGLEIGEGVVLLMRQENWDRLQLRLEAAGADPAGAIARGQVFQYEADETLASLMKGGMPDEDAFREVIGGAISKARRNYPKIRAFGEMVDILWQRGHRLGAQHLERLWNDLIQQRPFALFCAYCMDPLHESAYGGPIENVCKAHTHLIPARDYGRFDAAVVHASEAILNPSLSGLLQSLAEKKRAVTGMPPGQATIMWLMENMPRTADRILERVRTRYSEESAQAAL